jgi:hypothetical protein
MLESGEIRFDISAGRPLKFRLKVNNLGNLRNLAAVQLVRRVPIAHHANQMLCIITESFNV